MINEMKVLKMLEEKNGMKMPIPNFFYVERYGRCAQEQMDALVEGIGKKKWFLFKTDIRNKEGSLIDVFSMELEKYAKLGKIYDECVLIDIMEDIDIEDGFEEFVTYLKTLEDKIYFLFTMKQSKNTAFVQECMEQYFFIRKIEAKEYSVEEQMEAIKSVCEEYRYEIEAEAECILKEALEKKKWKAEEQVLCRLKNGVRSMVYEGMMEAGFLDGATVEAVAAGSFTLKMAEKMLSKIEPENKKRAVIGFSQGGLQYE